MNSYLKSKNSNLKIIISYYIIIFLLLIYSTFKNGIMLYQKELISFIAIFKPIFIAFLSISITYIINYIYKKKDYKLLDDYNPIYLSLILLTLPININIFIIIGIIIFSNIIKLFYKSNLINYYVVLKLLIVLLLVLFNKYSYLNLYELNIETNYSLIDLFLGKSIGGIATTNILLLIICYIILLFNIYKREIPIISLLSYIGIMLISILIFKSDFNVEINSLITSEFIYAIILIATFSYYSPIRSKEKVIYAIFIGILSYIFNKITNIYEGVFIAILLSNILTVAYKKIEKVVLNGHKRV